jgi:hypothetical protein
MSEKAASIRHVRTEAGEHIHARLAALGVTVTPLDPAECAAWRARWRLTYGGPQAQFGSGHLREYDWHLFSFRHAPALAFAEAIAAYRKERARELMVIPSEDDGPGFRLEVTGEMPDLEGFAYDFMVCPPDLSWTLACTHEDGCVGPFFARPEKTL